MIDVLSHGRLEVGFVRGVPYEILPANSNPVRMNERHWEALDLIVKAWTNHDGRSATKAASSITAASTSGRADSAAASADLGLDDQHRGSAQVGAHVTSRPPS